MGRFVSGGLIGVPRSLRQVFETSNPSFPIPSWARFMRVSGVGGGASGGIRTTTGNRGSGGGSGFHATDLPLAIPTGITTIAVAIGAAGAAASAAAAANGNAGGDTTLSFGAVVALRLNGGPSGLSSGAPPSLPTSLGAEVYRPSGITGVVGSFAFAAIGGPSGSNPFLNGAISGGEGTAANGGFGAGGSSLFGRGGDGVAAGPSVNTNGGNASGYGAGGAGALWLSGGAVQSGAGTPGILICEFLETLQ